jgi:hypothetical protein
MVLLGNAHTARVAVFGTRRSREITRRAELLRVHHVIELEHFVIVKGPIVRRDHARVGIPHRRPAAQTGDDQRSKDGEMSPGNDLGVFGTQRGQHVDEKGEVGAENQAEIKEGQNGVAYVCDIVPTTTHAIHAARAENATKTTGDAGK